MKIIDQANREQWPELCRRPGINSERLEKDVHGLLGRVRSGGLQALREMSLQFDGYLPIPVEVDLKSIREAEGKLPEDLKEAIRMAAGNIDTFHRSQLRKPERIETSKGVYCWHKDVAIESVGLYIPGGTAPLFSTVLMLGIPAKIAGCRNVTLCTPADKNGEINPAILFAADLCGIEKIYRLGGVQAIGAMAYGISPLKKVDKIFGPGNQYVTMAKQIVSRQGVAIDMPAGPSEVLVMADETANPAFVAADLISQAEHGPDSQVVVLATSGEIIDQVSKELDVILENLPRKDMAIKALENSVGIVMNNTGEMMDFSNEYAPEHLIISTANASQWAEKVINAGSVFIGNYSPGSAGDYASGTNHTLPTNAYARTYSGLTTGSFMKTIQFQVLEHDGIAGIGPAIMKMARAEGLEGHSLAVELRLKKLGYEKV